MSTLPTLRPESVQELSRIAPEALALNTQSHDRALAAGQPLLEAPMTDESDAQMALYIDRCRKTLRKMNDQRAPITQLFDQIRSAFTTLEADIDPTRKDTLPHRLQQRRNAYAAEKRAAAEAERQAALREQQRQAALAQYEADGEATLREELRRLIDAETSILQERYEELQVFPDGSDNLPRVRNAIGAHPDTLDPEWLPSAIARIFRPDFRPAFITPQDVVLIAMRVRNAARRDFPAEFQTLIAATRQELLALLPSRLAELKAIAASSTEEAARRREEMERREAALQTEREERARQAQAAAEAAALTKQQEAAAADLFAKSAATVQTYQPKTSVKRRLVPLNPEAFPEIINLWWVKEGSRLSVEELSKIFKKQLTYCERLANHKTEPVTLPSEHISYEEEVKAK